MHSYKLLFLIILLLFPLCNNCICQTEIEKQNKDVKREEVQRYFGYEALLPAYLTLPIDASLNTNERGYFVEVGFLFLILLPILLLNRIKHTNKLYFLALLAFFFIISAAYASTSFVLSDKLHKITFGQISYYTETNSSLLEDVYGQFLIGLNNIANPINTVISNISARTDYTSYPILILLCFSFIFIIDKISSAKLTNLLSVFILAFGFYWLLLSAGIPWYGYLLFPVLLGLILREFSFKKTKWIKNFGLILTASWIIIALANRISLISLTPNIDYANAGKNIVYPQLLNRTLGIESTENTINKIHPNIESIQQIINSETESLVLKVGTTLSYFIENNGARLYQDNQLGFFEKVHKRHKNQEEITNALKGEGFKYILADLNTHTLDRTPERTLTKKFNNFLTYLINNQQLRLIGTDRILHDQSDGLNNRFKYGMVGSIYDNGSYAVYEIL